MNKIGMVNVGDRIGLGKGKGTWRVDAMDGQYLYLSRRIRGAVETWKMLATRSFS